MAYFECAVVGESTKWIINEMTVFDEDIYEMMGYKFNKTLLAVDQNGRQHVHHLSLEFEARRDRNGTTVRCAALQDGFTVSKIAHLIVMGK